MKDELNNDIYSNSQSDNDDFELTSEQKQTSISENEFEINSESSDFSADKPIEDSTANNFTDNYTDESQNDEIKTESIINDDSSKSKIKARKKTSGALTIVLTALITSIFCLGIGFLLIKDRLIPNNSGNSNINQPYSQGSSQNESESAQNNTPPSLSLIIGSGVSSSDSAEKNILLNCRRSIVSISVEMTTTSYFGESVTTGSGSGVIITPDGYIATCYHVISNASKITVCLQDGTTYDAAVKGYDSRTDIAILKIDEDNLPAATIGDSSAYNVGDKIYAIGNPLGEFASTVTDGIISGIDRVTEIDGISMTLMQTNAAINPGNSGGGLFSADTGELIGIVNSKSYGLEIEGLGFAIPTSTAKSIITDLMDKGFVTGRPYIGISMKTFATNTGYFFGMASSTYVKIMDVTDGSPAQKAGLKVDDIILAFGGTSISSVDNLGNLLNNYNAGDQVDMIIQRNNKQMTVTITLGEASGRS